MNKKINILDTNVFLHDPQVLHKFPEEIIVIPIAVIEELDKFKKDQTELGRNARWVIKEIDKIRASNDPNQISQASDIKNINTYGLSLENGGRLVIEMNHINLIENLDSSIMDNRIVSVAKYYKNLFKNSQVRLYSMDANLRIKADANGVLPENYNADLIKDLNEESQYSGYREVNVDRDTLSSFRKMKQVKLSDVKLHSNEYVILKESDSMFGLGRYDAKKDAVVSLIQHSESLWGIFPKNIEQEFAVDALLNPEIHLVTLSGKAGTGKTLLSVAAGLFQSLDQSLYQKLLIARPVVPMGKDIGYLPGDINEKLNPWMQPIFDNLEFLMNRGKTERSRNGKRYEELIAQGLIQVEALTYIRGRSIPNQFFIIDESQNLTKHELKTIVSRSGMGTKIVLTGDPDQIDTSYVDKLSNGLSILIEHLKDEDLAAHVELKQGERSPLAEMIVNKIK